MLTDNNAAEWKNLDPPCRQKPPWGASNTSLWNYFSFGWTYNLLKVGKKRDLVIDDVDEIDELDSCKYLINKFFEGWNYQLKNNPNNPNLYFAILYMLGKKRFILTCSSVSIYFLLNLAIIIAFQQVLKFIEKSDNSVTFEQSILYSFLIFMFSVIYIAHGHWLFYNSTKMGINTRQAMAAVILYKSLMISPNSVPSAQVMNLMSTDAQRFQLTIRRSPLPLLLPLLLPGIAVLCYFVDSWYPILGLILYFLLYVIYYIYLLL